MTGQMNTRKGRREQPKNTARCDVQRQAFQYLEETKHHNQKLHMTKEQD
ncbi:hypothetical protein BofuT4_uP152640.1 [Botrytis cinerea T4]|uniref:Uncharacterized protein n=1 Tax=Botryotinia fuckeliana (strain T4) TaxID=999810 RepID=G2YVQ4_BOTF4|nr:hypothetical protein BofuT4_uP152640.1 [Botrytis cinerea T4]